MEDLINKKIAVLGVGQEGIAVTRYLLRHGINCELLDEKDYRFWPDEAQELASSNSLSVISGQKYLSDLKRYDFIFRSPGVWRLSPELIEAEKYGVKISSQAKWFFKFCPAKIIGITGTKGKGTTSSLIYEILLKAKEQNNFAPNKFLTSSSNIKLTGNIGKIQPLDFLDDLKSEDVIVYELSSFQLQDLTQSPQISVVLMTTQDHLDKHANLEEYHDSKKNITSHQGENDYLIVNVDYPGSKQIAENSFAQKLEVSTSKVDNGCQIEEDKLNFKITRLNLSESINTDIVLLKGRHNLENIAAGSLTALVAGASLESVKQAISEFKGLEHRLSLVGTKNGISFYDDSFATVPETTIAAIKSFSEPEILILGGSEKNSDFNVLSEVIINQKNLKALIVIGQTTERLIEALDEAGKFEGKIFTGAQNMKEVFRQIKEIATSGDVVLLSPACASFGMFTDYKDRGNKFIEEANKF